MGSSLAYGTNPYASSKFNYFFLFNKNSPARALQSIWQLTQTQMNKRDFQQFLANCTQVSSPEHHPTILRVQETQQLLALRHLPGGADLLPVLSQQKQLAFEHLESVVDYCLVGSDRIAVLTDYSTHTLWDELVARSKSDTRFTIEELENILVSVVKALRYLESRAVGHGCVSARDVVISQNGTVKLIDPCLASSSPLALVPGYLYSPELLAYNKSQKSNCLSSLTTETVDFFKNDIFVLGLLIVELGLLHCDVSECILIQQGVVDYKVMEKYLDEFQSLYSSTSFINLLVGMLYEDPGMRMDAQGILDFIEEQFQNSDEEDLYDSEESASMLNSKQKTVNSFLLSRGHTYSQEPSLSSSRESMQVENNSMLNNRHIQLSVAHRKPPLQH